MSQATISGKTKHIYYADVADEGGRRAMIMTGIITIDSASGATATLNPNFTSDIPVLDTVMIQGEDGYVVQYEYSTANIKILQVITANANPLVVTTNSTLTGLNFRYFAWGY
jgi:hypothetical protein